MKNCSVSLLLVFAVTARKLRSAASIGSEDVNRALLAMERSEEGEASFQISDLVFLPHPAAPLPKKVADLSSLPPSLLPPASLEDFEKSFADWG